MNLEDWYRQDRLPHIYCAGCGNGTVINCTLRAAQEVGLTLENTTFVSGIGCSSRAGGYTAADSLHTTHGRALAFATGVKLAKPKQHVIVFTGDGDCSAIGGNHFIHACRRNIDLTVICINNTIYGMTGGQGSPCTPKGAISTTTPYGMQEQPFDLCSLAAAAGANYVARWTSYHVKQLTKAIQVGLETPGLSFIEVRAQCPTAFGSKNKMKLVTQMTDFYRENAVLKQKVDAGQELTGSQFIVGEFVRRNNPALGVEVKK
ncbi:MAG TPA: thiamine pyrophosphate-dependent enzyme [Methanocorpusculum sp.]|nr:thiamine pyrophosphate-dependent enzyme [Methanocorpusculum sp.]HJJ39900.1 thiamine pyrophosphate-dependent enzyme [Methanocorpusculum sp.]HJJ49147.1 thiamine pyrophosphate-dependent enzyme [Methanocorpusculum sp.]HJJ56805.1 thiamine pyrophosphate-dependent enzyme [Methanocorpusculum sp.]